MKNELDDCWNPSGVRGDRSCARLEQHVHCRNCDVFEAAASTILRRALPAGYREEWAARLAEPLPEPRDADRSVLVFRTGSEWLALPARVLQFVHEPAPVRRLPHRHDAVLLGVANLRGQLYPCVSLEQLLHVPTVEAEVTASTTQRVQARLLAVRLADQAMALPVSEVLGVQRYAQSDLLSPSSALAEAQPRYIEGILALGDRRVGCLDAELLGLQLARHLK